MPKQITVKHTARLAGKHIIAARDYAPKDRPEIVARDASRATRRAHTTADDCFEAMRRHNERNKILCGRTAAPPKPASEAAPAGGNGQGGSGDIIYGARAIACFLFDDDSNTARRRVFNLWAHYRLRNERAGFFKLKGALCLSRSQWLAFHGLG